MGPGAGSGRRQRADVHAGDGGAGAGVEGVIPVTPGETLTLVVGEGAPGGAGVTDNNYGRGGFGAPYTAIKRGSTHLVIAAGGGGGGGNGYSNRVGGDGGAGGYPAGQTGTAGDALNIGGGGGTQSAGVRRA